MPTMPPMPWSRVPWLICVVAATWAFATPAVAQTDSLARELAGIRQSLERIVQLLERQSVQAEKSLLLRRIEMKNSRLLPIEAGIRNALDSQRAVDQQLNQMNAHRSQIDRESAEATPGSKEALDAAELQRQLDVELDRLEQEVFVQTQRLQDLEVERNDILAEIRTLERRLDGDRP